MALLGLSKTTIRLLVIAVTAGLVQARAEAPGINEYQVKAAFLVNFAKFVIWPATPNSAEAPFQICVLGQNPFGSALEDMVQGRDFEGKAFLINRIADARQAAGCHVLFISAAEWKRSRPLLSDLKGFHILTVGETDDFLPQGGIVRFKLKSAQVRFEIDADAAVREKLKISSKLLSLGDTKKQ